MKVIIFGATGMIGAGALVECLEDPSVERVLAVVRRPTGRESPKLVELVHQDFLDYSAVQSEFAGCDACLYCLGVSSFRMSEADYRRITYDFTLAAAEALLRQNPNMRMCFVSGAGTDPNSRTMWARIKGEAEAALLAMPWKSAHMFRPAGILPKKGVVSGVRSYRILYGALGWTYPLIKPLAKNSLTTSDQLGRAMIEVAKNGHEKAILEGADINAVTA